VETGFQPCQQAGLCGAQIDACHTDLGKSEFRRPPAQLLQQLPPIELMSLSHPAILETRSFGWPDEAACAAWAGQLARRDAVHDAYIELHGPLGAGKTTFVRHLLRALGASGRIKSPTFAVMEPYTLGPLEVSHFDFYRFSDPREWEDAGLRDVFGRPGLKLAEWPENAAGALPLPDLRLSIDVADDETRLVHATAFTPTGVALLE
jgi:tRNA threonylcarbamoyladenosine biosynthesis protein TsaE